MPRLCKRARDPDSTNGVAEIQRRFEFNKELHRLVHGVNPRLMNALMWSLCTRAVLGHFDVDDARRKLFIEEIECRKFQGSLGSAHRLCGAVDMLTRAATSPSTGKSSHRYRAIRLLACILELIPPICTCTPRWSSPRFAASGYTCYFDMDDKLRDARAFVLRNDISYVFATISYIAGQNRSYQLSSLFRRALM